MEEIDYMNIDILVTVPLLFQKNTTCIFTLNREDKLMKR
jgi:hypothetical protein